jgi:hypothetical protein
MRNVLVVLAIAALLVPAMGLNQVQTSWLDGVNNGYQLGVLAWQARGNQTAADLYNAQVDKLNALFKVTMNETDYKVNELGHIHPIVTQSDLPEFLRST